MSSSLNETSVFVSGVFNSLHAGHLRLLKYARELGSSLTVGVFSDDLAGIAATVSQEARIAAIESLDFISDTVLIDVSLEKCIEHLKPDLVVKGQEFAEAFNPEQKTVDSYGAQLIFSSGNASSTLSHRSNHAPQDSGIKLPLALMARHGLDKIHLRETIGKFDSVRACVIGDLIVDKYIDCVALGMSREDASLVVAPARESHYLGGAGIVAAHLQAAGASTHIISIRGEDEAGDFAASKLAEYGVTSHLVVDPSRPTTEKARLRVDDRSLLRVNKVRDHVISPYFQDEVMASFRFVAERGLDLLVFSDFNYGGLPQLLVENLVHEARSLGIFIAADSQSSSQLGNIARFSGVDLVTPTEHEARVALHAPSEGLVQVASTLAERANCGLVFLTLGEDGLLIFMKHYLPSGESTERVDSLAGLVRDVAGAGDALLAISAMSLAVKADPVAAGILGSLAAAVQVTQQGNRPMAIQSLRDLVSG